MRALACVFLLILAACDGRGPGLPTVSVIGEEPRLREVVTARLAPADAQLAAAAAEGLVRLDAGGEIEGGLAERWSVSDDGLSYIFRLGRRQWPDGRPVTAHFVARRLRSTLAGASAHPFRAFLRGIESIQSTTAEVLEIRLAAPRPNLLQLLAQPEMGMVRENYGAGPFRVERRDIHGLHLVREVPLADDEAVRRDEVVLVGERAALAIARFAAGGAQLVTGGTVGDLALARASEAPGRALRFDPAIGLFGLAAVDARGPLKEARLREAMAMAIDRDGLVAALGVDGLAPRTTLLPAGGGTSPTPPRWQGLALGDRQAFARRAVGAALSIRVAMPEGPGYRLVFAHLARDWRRIGVTAEAVPFTANADLRFVDEVAPSAGASWFLERFRCGRAAAVCSKEADTALDTAWLAAGPADRGLQLAAAERAHSLAHLFIPMAAPIRWSLVAEEVTSFRPNPLARHNLVELAAEREE